MLSSLFELPYVVTTRQWEGLGTRLTKSLSYRRRRLRGSSNTNKKRKKTKQWRLIQKLGEGRQMIDVVLCDMMHIYLLTV